MRLLHLATAACVATSLPASELAAQGETPQQVFEQMMAATRASDWGRTATFMHPDALKQLRSMFDPILALTSEEGNAIRLQIFGFGSLKEAAEASDSTIFIRLMNGLISQQQGLADAMRTAKFQYLGTIEEGKDTVHVVGRIAMTVESIPVSQVEVTSLMRYKDTWRGILKGDMVAMASALRTAIERNR